MNKDRIARLTKDIQHLQRELAKELGFASAHKMNRGLKRYVDHVQAVRAGLTVKEWKHTQEKSK